jgi:hypothetical protein
MQNNIFLPKTIRVGCQKRNGTYTGKLAYIIYIDQKGKVRKETSWNSWRDKKIPSEDFDNVPTEGFVLNKKVGGDSWSGWNHRQTYCRVYDPRGFEFEINVENLLYVLEHTSSIKGKGLEGEFVYGWSGTELILIPTSSPDYVELSKYNETLHSAKKFKLADMITGATYLTKKNEELIYMGRYEGFAHESWYSDGEDSKSRGNMYFFMKSDGKTLRLVKTLSQVIISCISEDCVDNYAELFDVMEKSPNYSKVDLTKDKKKFYTVKQFKEEFKSRWGEKRYTDSTRCFSDHHDAMFDNKNSLEYKEDDDKVVQTGYRSNLSGGYWSRGAYFTNELGTLAEFVAKYKPYYINRFLTNGKPFKKVTK